MINPESLITFGSENPLFIEPSPPKGKILTYQGAIEAIKKARECGLRTILVQGSFDLVHLEPNMHTEHIAQLCEAKKAADMLFLGLENDDTVRLNNGQGQPFSPIGERLALLAESSEVDFVFSFDDAIIYGASAEQYVRRYSELSPDLLSVALSGRRIDIIVRQAIEAGVNIVLIEDRASYLQDSFNPPLVHLGGEVD